MAGSDRRIDVTEGGIITVALTVIAAVVWGVRVEGIVRSHEKQIEQLRQDMNSKVTEVLMEVRYIRQRVDEALEHRRG